jgi:hypothetical protein
MTAQARVKRGIRQNLLGRNGRKAPDVAPAVTEPSQQLAAPDFDARGVSPLRRDSWEQDDDITQLTFQRSEAS